MEYVEVAPAARLPADRSILTYSATADQLPSLGVGQLVWVTVRGRNVWGVITGFSRTQPKHIRRLATISAVTPIRLPQALVQTAITIARDTWQPVGIVLASIIPPPLKRFRSAQLNIPKKESHKTAKTVVVVGSTAERFTQYLAIAAKARQANQGTIIALAHHAELEAFIDQCTIPIVRWDSNDNATTRWKTWFAVAQAEAPIVVGLRTAIWAPVPALGAIIVDNPFERGHKPDNAPYLTTQTIALARQETEPCWVVTGDEVPPINPKVSVLKTATSRRSPITLLATTGSARNERETAIDWLQHTLDHRDRCFVLVNQVGRGHLRCNSCQRLFHCPTCDALATVTGTSVQCYRCGWRQTNVGMCSQCGGTFRNSSGGGTESLATMLQTALKRTVRIADRNHTDWVGSTDTLTVGTEFALPFFGANPVDYSVILGINYVRHAPVYTANEHARRLIARVQNSTKRETAIVTSSPESLWLLAVQQNQATELRNEDRRDRQRYHYPPFGKLLLFRSASLSAIERLFGWFSHQSIPVYPPSKSQDGRSFRLIIRLSTHRSNGQLFQALTRQKLLNDITIDTDPIPEALD